MTAIALESEIIATRYDPKTRTCFYTIQRDGKRWTAAVPVDHLEKHKGNRQNRRNHVAAVITNAMRGPHDPPVVGTKDNPAKPATWQDFDALPRLTWFLNPSDGTLQQKTE